MLACADSSQAESPAPHFPQAVFSPYQSSFVWNPPGASLDGVAFPFPIIMLNNDTAIQLQAKADYNQQKASITSIPLLQWLFCGKVLFLSLLWQ